MCNCSSDAVGFLFFEVAFGIYDFFFNLLVLFAAYCRLRFGRKVALPIIITIIIRAEGLGSIRAVGLVIRGEHHHLPPNS